MKKHKEIYVFGWEQNILRYYNVMIGRFYVG